MAMTKAKKKARVTGEIYNHRLLWHAAQCLYDAATREELGSAHRTLAAMLFVYTALEGYLNDIGSRFRPDTWANEREFFGRGQYHGTLGKLDYLLDELGLTADRGIRPYQTVKTLDTHRDGLIHPRTEIVDWIIEYTDPEKVPLRKEPELYGYEDPAFVGRALEDVEEICDLIQAAVTERLGEARVPGRRAFVGSIWIQGGSLDISDA